MIPKSVTFILHMILTYIVLAALGFDPPPNFSHHQKFGQPYYHQGILGSTPTKAIAYIEGSNYKGNITFWERNFAYSPVITDVFLQGLVPNQTYILQIHDWGVNITLDDCGHAGNVTVSPGTVKANSHGVVWQRIYNYNFTLHGDIFSILGRALSMRSSGSTSRTYLFCTHIGLLDEEVWLYETKWLRRR